MSQQSDAWLSPLQVGAPSCRPSLRNSLTSGQLAVLAVVDALLGGGVAVDGEGGDGLAADHGGLAHGLGTDLGGTAHGTGSGGGALDNLGGELGGTLDTGQEYIACRHDVSLYAYAYYGGV